MVSNSTGTGWQWLRSTGVSDVRNTAASRVKQVRDQSKRIT